jgi:hypothetical protein
MARRVTLTRAVTVRFTAEQYAQLSRAARAAKTGLSPYIREKATGMPHATATRSSDAVLERIHGLTFVPELVRSVELEGVSVKAAHEALLRLARERRIELQPESGVGRLTAEDLALCPPGPQGSRLSWARRLEEVYRG